MEAEIKVHLSTNPTLSYHRKRKDGFTVVKPFVPDHTKVHFRAGYLPRLVCGTVLNYGCEFFDTLCIKRWKSVATA
jgi:hypothetical protein